MAKQTSQPYNYSHFRYSYYLSGKKRRVSSGKPALNEIIYTLEGNKARLSDLWDEKPIVVEFGSITCPVFVAKIANMESLAKKYSGRIDFYVLYVREAHPAKNYPAHKNFSEKLNNANDLKRLEMIERTILVDSFEGSMNKDYGAMPNSVYVIGRDGIILYRADWNDPNAVEKQLKLLLKNNGYAANLKPLSVEDNFSRPTPQLLLTAYKVLSCSGFTAPIDFFISMPFLLLGRIKLLLRSR